jgi:hypothetical protein
MAVAVASGTSFLLRFPVPTPGRVLLFAAEDALYIVRRRLEGICTAGLRWMCSDYRTHRASGPAG